MEERSKAQQRERFRQYLRARLAQTGVTKRELSLAMGKDRSYITQLLDEEQTRSRALPDPDDLRRAAPLLGVPLVELLEQAYGITRHELERELGELARHNEAWATGYAELTMAQQEQVRTFIAYVKGQGESDPAELPSRSRHREQTAVTSAAEETPVAARLQRRK